MSVQCIIHSVLYSKKDIKCAKKQEKLIIIKVKGIQYIQTMGPPR